MAHTAVLERCPPELQHLPQPQYGGLLFQHQELGRSGCQRCGWSGVPTIRDGVISTRCPHCEREPDDAPVVANGAPSRVPRNQPCPCHSGLKAKKCPCPEYTV